VAIYDRDHARASRLAGWVSSKSRRPVSPDCDLSTFLGRGLDLVHVTSSPWSHHDLTIAALRAGANVFTEKPMAMNLAEAEAMADEAASHNRLLCVSHNFLYADSMRRARLRLGDTPVEYVTGLQLSSASRRLPSWYRDLPGGLMFDEIPHMVYTLSGLLGGKLALDHARATFAPGGHPQTVEILLRGRSSSGQITMVFSSPVSEWHVMACNSGQVIGIDLFRDIMMRLGPDGAHGSLDIARSSLSAIAGHVTGFAQTGARWMRRRQYWGHDALIGAVVDAIKTDRPSPVAVADALNVVAFTDSLITALELRTA
jgi:predicted dehydrogenase